MEKVIGPLSPISMGYLGLKMSLQSKNWPTELHHVEREKKKDFRAEILPRRL